MVSNKLQPRAEPRFCGWGKYRGTSAGTLPASFEYTSSTPLFLRNYVLNGLSYLINQPLIPRSGDL